MKVVLAGETFDYDGTKAPTHEALWIEHVYKRRYGEWQEDLQAGSAKALIMLACLIWRRDGRDADAAYKDIIDGNADFDLNEMLQSMAAAAEADAEAAAEAEAEAAAAGLPTPAGSGPAGSPTTSSGTSASSPSTSTSAPGKSGASKSRSSRR